MSDKPTIIVLCGKSASGKDTLLKWLSIRLLKNGIECKKIISDTTRPPRIGEQDGEDYNFINTTEFLNRKDNAYYIEFSEFNNWYYGTPLNQLSKNKINIGIFNVDGIKSLYNYIDSYNIYIVYLECGLFERIKRSVKREHKISFEMIRRIFADEKDFMNFREYLSLFKYKTILSSPLITINAKIIESYIRDKHLI